MDIDLSRFHETFFQESDENLAAMEAGLLALESGTEPAESLHAVFRAAHSIKGGSGTFGFDEVSRFTHELETILDRLRSGRLQPTRERVALLLESTDVLRELLEAARTGRPGSPRTREFGGRLTEASQPPAPGAETSTPHTPAPQASVYAIHFAPSEEVLRQGMDPVLVLRSLARIGAILGCTLDLSALPSLSELDPDSCYLSWRLRLSTSASAEEIRDVFAFVEDGAAIAVAVESGQEEQATPAAATPRPAVVHSSPEKARSPQRESTSIRVATRKVDRLIDLVGELVIAQSMANEILDDFTVARLPELTGAFASMARYTHELQERVMGIRMVPVGSVFSRFPRLVHDLAASTGKHITLEMTGEETELDKAVVERMADPLTHLVRNAIDHGIESPADRAAAGKSAQGTLSLRAFHQGGNVIVEVSDDGRGINLRTLRQKAEERGILQPDQVVADRDIQSLIFHPGFSTASEVSGLSGRGVGMDVVKREVESLNGAVSLHSESGRGLTIRIKLPLTLAILEGLLLKVGDQTYILPLTQILESVRPLPSQCKTLPGGDRLVVIRGESVPLLELHRIFGVPSPITDPSSGLVVLVDHQGRRLALLVDELLGQQQVVIKSLETHFRKVDGVAGATILGDGRAALILDVAGLALLALPRAA